MRNGDFQATREEQLIPCSREIKEQFPSPESPRLSLEEVRGSLCLGDCLGGSGEGEREGSGSAFLGVSRGIKEDCRGL